MQRQNVCILTLAVTLFISVTLAAPDNKKPSTNGNPITSFFSNVLSYIQSGISTLFGVESRSSNTNSRVNYRGFQLLRATPRTPDQLLEMRGLEDEFEGVKFWKEPRARNISADFQVPPDLVINVKSFFRERQIDFEVLSQDLQNMIAQHNPKMSKERRDELRDATGHSMSWRRYHRFADIMTYLDYLTSKYPDTVTVEKIGKSYGGLPLRLIRISAPAVKQGASNRPAIWIDGGTHAREWISPAVATYIIKQLVENAQVNKLLLDNFDWYILPVVNPDGYEYSHTSDRLWRKTRSSGDDDDDDDIKRSSRIARVFFGSCDGVDLNRNWDFHWGERGASDDPCDETYAGPRAFSEPETRAIADFIMARRTTLKLFLTLHSYGQMWLLPWGYTSEKVADYDDLMTLGQEAVNALTKVQGTEFSLGQATTLLYHSSGGSDDWAKGVAGIKYAYTVELRDKGDSGFLLPASQIIPTGKETFAAIKAMVKTMAPAPPVKVKRPNKPPQRPVNINKPNANATVSKNKTPAKPAKQNATDDTMPISPRGRGRISSLSLSD